MYAILFYDCAIRRVIIWGQFLTHISHKTPFALFPHNYGNHRWWILARRAKKRREKRDEEGKTTVLDPFRKDVINRKDATKDNNQIYPSRKVEVDKT